MRVPLTHPRLADLLRLLQQDHSHPVGLREQIPRQLHAHPYRPVRDLLRDVVELDLRVGAGVIATSGSLMVVEYTGWLYAAEKPDQKGLQFDSSVGIAPLEFTLGEGDVIAGWDLGLLGLKVGGLRRLVIPPSLAYGSVRQGPIPPNTSLVFEVELLEIKEPQ